MDDRDNPRKHNVVDQTDCDGDLERRQCRDFAVKWHYGKNDKVGCLLGPSQNTYHDRGKIKKSRIVSGPSYSGPQQKDPKQ
jgi:hypothetical protein